MVNCKRRWAFLTGAVLFLIAAARVKRDLRAPDLAREGRYLAEFSEPMRPAGAQRARSWRKLAPAFVALAAVVSASVYLYFDFARISDFPVRPPEAGEVRLYFDKPGVPALMEVRVDEQRGQINVVVSVGKTYERGEAGFLLVFSGPVSRPPDLPIHRAQDEHGCWKSIYVLPEDPSVACEVVKASADGQQGAPKDTEQLVISGRIDLRTEQKPRFAQITIYPDHRYATSAGKRTYFKLPGFGTHLPSSFRGLPLDFDTGKFVFAPSKLAVVLDYRELKPHEKVESVAPALESPGKLSWVEADASMVRPWGALVDMEVEDSAQRRLFVIGVLVGLLGGVGTSIVAWLWARIAEPKTSEPS